MNYFEDLLNKIKRHISGYKKVHINLSLHFSPIYDERKESKNEWERFVKEYNPELKKMYRGENNDPELSECFYYLMLFVAFDRCKKFKWEGDCD